MNLHKLYDILRHLDFDVSMCGLRMLNLVDVPRTASAAVVSRLSAVVVTLLFRIMRSSIDKGDYSVDDYGISPLYWRVIHLVYHCILQ